MRSLLQASSAPPPPDKQTLQAYYAVNKGAYRESARLTFSEYFVAKGSRAEDRARSLLLQLRAGEPVADPPVLHSARPEQELASLYGDELVQKVRAAPSHTWQLVRSARGLHVIKLAALTPEREPTFAEVRTRVAADLAAEQEREQFQAHLRDLIARWQGVEARGQKQERP
jgi:hypothetical protein